MNEKATRMLFAAVALSALAAVLVSSAQARIPEGNGTQPPGRTVVKVTQARTFTVDHEICMALDRAIRLAIPQCSHRGDAKVIRTDSGAAPAGPASAEPVKRCYGQLVSGINTTWPWAHFDQEAFPPPPVRSPCGCSCSGRTLASTRFANSSCASAASNETFRQKEEGTRPTSF